MHTHTCIYIYIYIYIYTHQYRRDFEQCFRHWIHVAIKKLPPWGPSENSIVGYCLQAPAKLTPGSSCVGAGSQEGRLMVW